MKQLANFNRKKPNIIIGWTKRVPDQAKFKTFLAPLRIHMRVCRKNSRQIDIIHTEHKNTDPWGEKWNFQPSPAGSNDTKFKKKTKAIRLRITFPPAKHQYRTERIHRGRVRNLLARLRIHMCVYREYTGANSEAHTEHTTNIIIGSSLIRQSMAHFNKIGDKKGEPIWSEDFGCGSGSGYSPKSETAAITKNKDASGFVT
jgi:hypothetical protein